MGAAGLTCGGGTAMLFSNKSIYRALQVAGLFSARLMVRSLLFSALQVYRRFS
jgi:hypothetical protein